MEFRQIEYILTLAETRNMTRAAEKLFISQPALSHYLKCVEEELEPGSLTARQRR